jgi:hypothetical protein
MARPKAQNGKDERLTIAVEPEVAQQIREIAKAESMPMSVLMRRWINEGIRRTRQAEREQGAGQ